MIMVPRLSKNGSLRADLDYLDAINLNKEILNDFAQNYGFEAL